jgi:hypothetical protein
VPTISLGVFEMTFTYSGQRIGTPHSRRRTADDFDLLDLRGIDRDEVPHHEPEEVLIDRAAVEQDQCGVLERSLSVPAW